ncbi:MAG: glycosyltransferase family 9 protein [Planctomycetota bacterium]|jgi:ADP-heptose:LPS heptosyltransferase
MRLLIEAGGGIGNVVMATPAMAALRAMGYRVSAWLLPEAAGAIGLLHGWSALDSVISGPPPAPPDFDMVVHTVWSHRRGIHPREFFPGPVDLTITHEAEANMIPVRALGFAGPTPPPHVEHDAHAPDAFGLAGGGCCVLAPGCNRDLFWDRKRWGGWKALADELARRGAMCAFLGTRRESRGWMTGPGRVDLTGRTTVRQAAGVMAGARCVVGIDCGLGHVAAALGVPTLVMFGATSEVKNRPLGPRVRVMTRDVLCRPCQMTPEWDACARWRCMAFDPAEVVAAVDGLLHHGGTEALRTT